MKQVDDAHGIDVLILMHNLIEYSHTYPKNIRKFMAIRDEPPLNNDDTIIDFPVDNNNRK